MNDIINRLFTVIQDRKNAEPAESYVASLYAKGVDKICGKLAEEAAETIIEAARGDREKIAAESADLLFHLMVLWAQTGVFPQDVLAILEKRFGIGGHEEKASRKA